MLGGTLGLVLKIERPDGRWQNKSKSSNYDYSTTTT